jgi:Ca2+-binding EF-hand superfamily protein
LTPQEQELLQRYDKNGDGKLDAAELDAAHGAAYQAKLGRDVLARQLYDRLLEQFDTAHEGKLNADQQKQAVDFLQANRPRVFEALTKQFDRNGDGKLDANEITALFQYLSNLPSDLDAVGQGGAPSGRVPPAPVVPPSPPAAPATPAVPATPDLSASLDAVPATPPPPAKGAKGGGGAMGARFYSLLLQKFDHDNQGSLTPAEQAEAMAYLASNNPRLYARLLTRFDRNGDGRLDADETARMFDRLAKMSARASSSE